MCDILPVHAMCDGRRHISKRDRARVLHRMPRATLLGARALQAQIGHIRTATPIDITTAMLFAMAHRLSYVYLVTLEPLKYVFSVRRAWYVRN